MLVSLVVAALTFVYALFFLTGSAAYATQYTGENSINAENFVEQSQGFVSSMITICIIFIVLAAVMYITSCHSRRNYYITNYIAIGAFAAFALFIVIYLFVKVSTTMDLFLNEINWDIVPEKVTALRGEYPMSKSDTYTYAIGYVVAVIVLADAALLVLNVVWKYLLMKGEKQLLEGSVKEVA